MRKTRRGLASACALLLLAGVTFATAPAASGASDKIYVLNNNIENRKCEKYNFEYLLAEVAKSGVIPDVLTLQQVSGEAELEAIVQRLEHHWKVKFAGKVAFAKTAKKTEANLVTALCSTKKTAQANAVLWRTDRFELASTAAKSVKRWTADAQVPVGTTCKNVPVSFKGNDKQVEYLNERSISIAVALKDTKAAGKVFLVASVHWPKQPRDQSKKKKADRKKADVTLYGRIDAHSCLKSNLDETESALNRLNEEAAPGVDAPMIIGGDMNGKPEAEGRWKYATSVRGFTDPIAVTCLAQGGLAYPRCNGNPDEKGSETARKNLNRGFRTSQVNRIDYILIKKARTFADASVVKQPEKMVDANGKKILLYSNHRAIRATVKW